MKSRIFLSVALLAFVSMASDDLNAASCGGTCTNGTIDHAANDTYFCNTSNECITLAELAADQSCPGNWVYSGNCRGTSPGTRSRFQKYGYGWSESSTTAGKLQKKFDSETNAFIYKVAAVVDTGWSYVKDTVDGQCDCEAQFEDGTQGTALDCCLCT